MIMVICGQIQKGNFKLRATPPPPHPFHHANELIDFNLSALGKSGHARVALITGFFFFSRTVVFVLLCDKAENTCCFGGVVIWGCLSTLQAGGHGGVSAMSAQIRLLWGEC